MPVAVVASDAGGDDGAAAVVNAAGPVTPARPSCCIWRMIGLLF